MITVLIAGIGGASLGVEIAKSLRLAGDYRICGCDISELAFGHYSGHFDETVVADPASYVDSVLDISRRLGADVILPGGEQPARILSAAEERIKTAGLKLAGNNRAVVAELGDKARCFELLAELGVSIPRTVALNGPNEYRAAPLPAVVKPSTDSGGSAYVFFARTRDELALYAVYLVNNGLKPIAQEYIPHEGGEFTVGVLSSLQGKIEGAIALKRSFHVKLSVSSKGKDFLISSGYSQGHIGLYPDICAQARLIAEKVGSTGPLNVQGRIKDGRFVPFEINPRFSASNYLRALAGFNEVDLHVRQLCGVAPRAPLTVTPGWYLRGLSEVFVPDADVRS